MSSCGNCDCSDKTQCMKGNQYGIEVIENDNISYDGMMMSEGPECGSCKCGPSCSCTNCTCCSH